MLNSYYRVTRNNPPTVTDFTSHAASGWPAPAQPEGTRLWDGLSVYATEAQARRKARQIPLIGQFIAELQIANEAPVRVERTTTSAGHHTIWGDAAYLLGCVVRVLPV